MFEVKCTDCGKTTTVPFEPTKGKPVYCRPCLSKHRTRPRERSRDPIIFDMKNAWAGRTNNQERKREKKSVFSRT
jgi:CxxC-x17-CxxC domain-containing protein